MNLEISVENYNFIVIVMIIDWGKDFWVKVVGEWGVI